MAETQLPLFRWRPPGAYQFAFTTRQGGVSAAPFDSLNLGFTTGDNPSAVTENRRRVLSAVGADPERTSLTWPKHETAVVRASQVGVLARTIDPPGDGIWTDDPGRSLLVLSADCVPIAVSCEGPDAMAVVHAGWRSLEADIGASVVRALPPGKLSAALGPAIGPCCFRVDPELRGRFRERFGARVVTSDTIDLWTSTQVQLEDVGCRVDEVFAHCTMCGPERFYSYRRDGRRAGRQGVIGSPATQI